MSSSSSEKNLITAIAAHLEGMPPTERKQRILAFVAAEPSSKKIIRQYFPDLYHEVFQSSTSTQDASPSELKPN
jgi:hypothetical protein